MVRQRFYRYAPLVLGIGELLFYGELLFGWATLVYVLKEEGYYSHLCTNGTANNETTNEENTPPTCAEQDVILNLVFTVGIFSLQGGILFAGLLFDYFGTRFLRLLLHLLLLSGLIIMAFSSPSIPDLLFPGMVCITIGGFPILFTNIQIGNLFGNHRATIMTLLSGCLDSSSFVMLLIKLGYEGGISIQIAFGTLAGATSFFFINTFIFLPKRHIPWPLPPDYGQKKKKDDMTDLAEKMDENREEQDKENVPSKTSNDESNTVSRQLVVTRRKDFPTVKSCICCPLFVMFNIWFSVLQLRLLYFLGTLNPFLVQITDGDEKLVSQYTTIFSFYQLCGVFVAPFSGLILDRNKSRQSGSPRGPYEDLRDSVLAFTLTTLLYVVFSICNVIPVIEVLYVTYFLHIITRGFMYALTAAVLPIFFPSQYFGTLYGLVVAASSIIGLLQFPLFIVSQKYFDNDPLVINLILLMACMVTIILPIYIHFYTKRKNKDFNIKEIKEQRNESAGKDNPVNVEEI
ncbi:equilibrative nucleobase transporter 1-like [Amphiura filiformis]|uniref:equilibrative nucleobase transporter 1-like n=1 Tax=Amphiura filiformis TaxID=82378 RepID=UPI003B212A35